MKQIIRTMCFATALVMAAACGNKKEKAAEVAAVDEDPVVSVAAAVVKPVENIQTYTSTVEPFAKNNIAPQTGGRISKINVEVGDYVTKGQVVAEMDKTQLVQVELQLKNNEDELNRLRGLYEVGGLSKSELDQIELAYNVSKTNYENLLENSVLISPISGVITARNYDKGDMYTMSQPIYTVQQITPVKLLVGISESDYTKVRKGMKVEISAEALPGKTYEGRINRIYPTIDPATRTFSVEILVQNANRELRPGMFARVDVNFGERNSVLVPDVAVVRQQGSGEKFVYVLQSDGTVKYQNVKLGIRVGSEYEVLSGIGDGDLVVVAGQLRLKDGVKVSVN